MPLKNFAKPYVIDPNELWNSVLLKKFKQDVTERTFDMIVRVARDFVSARDESNSGGYFQFAICFGHSADHIKRDVDRVWQRMEEVYRGPDEKQYDYIRRCLGTILMAVTAEDKRFWYYKDDPEKRIKLEHGEIPLPNEYFIGKKYSVRGNKDTTNEGGGGGGEEIDVAKLASKFKVTITDNKKKK